MGRTIGATNKNTIIDPLLSNMSIEERLTLIASLIVKKMLADKDKNIKIYEVDYDTRATD